MSDDSEKQQPKDASPKETPKETWFQIQQDLRGALDTWTVISEKSVGTKPTEEEKLVEMRRLLADLKAKIRDFEGP